jgi:hypothetical protein
MTRHVSIPASADPLDPPDDDAPAADEVDRLAASVARAELRLLRLQELAGIGMDLARGLHRRAETADATQGAGEPKGEGSSDAAADDNAGAFAKLSRAIRLTIDLEARADEALRALLSGETAACEARREARRAAREALADEADEAEQDEFADRKARAITQVCRAIAAESESEDEERELFAALIERVECDDAYDGIHDEPLRKVVEHLSADLGLTPDWSTWTETGWSRRPEEQPLGRTRWSPFNTPSRKPILEKNKDCARVAEIWARAGFSP